MEKFYRSLLKRAWLITWRNKWLWVFGFFATLLANGTVGETIVRSYSNLSEGRSIFFTLREYVNQGVLSMFSWTRIMDVLRNDPGAFTLSLLGMLLMSAVIAVFIVMAVVSQAGLVKGAIALDLKKKISFRQAFALGVDKFWPVLMLNLVLKVVLWGGLLVLAFLFSLLATQGNLWQLVVYIITFVGILLMSIILYFITIYATAFVVLRDRTVGSALRLAWYIFHQNILLNLEVGLMLYLMYFVVALVTILITVFVASPFVLVYILMIVMAAQSGLGFVMGLILGIVAIMIILMGSIFTTFQITLWSLLFEELALKRGKSKIERIIHSLSNGKTKKKA